MVTITLNLFSFILMIWTLICDQRPRKTTNNHFLADFSHWNWNVCHKSAILDTSSWIPIFWLHYRNRRPWKPSSNYFQADLRKFSCREHNRWHTAAILDPPFLISQCVIWFNFDTLAISGSIEKWTTTKPSTARLFSSFICLQSSNTLILILVFKKLGFQEDFLFHHSEKKLP